MSLSLHSFKRDESIHILSLSVVRNKAKAKEAQQFSSSNEKPRSSGFFHIWPIIFLAHPLAVAAAPASTYTADARE